MPGCTYVSTAREVINSTCRVQRGTDDGFTEVRVRDLTTDVVNLYLYRNEVSPTLTSAVTAEDTVISINDNAGISNGDAITFYENSNFSQSIVKSTTAPPAATLTMQSPIDRSYTTGATVEIGAWNMNANGSVGAIEFYICPPPDLKFHITTIGFSMRDDSDMDSGKFGGLAALANGLLLRKENGVLQNLLLVVNNLGFAEQGYDLTYDDKAPAGTYGVRFRKDMIGRMGVVVELDGSSSDTLKAIVRDDLSGLVQITCTVMGHVCEC